MEKKKYQMKLADYEMAEDVTIGGEVIRVKPRIPLDQKMQLASELVQMIAAEDEEAGIVTRSSLENVCELYLIIKYYTDVDLEDVGVEQVYDWIIGYDAYGRIKDIVMGDYWEVTYMVDQMFDGVKETYQAQHSLAHAVKTSFGFLFDGRDITEVLAESRGVGDQMVEMIGRLDEAAKKDDAGHVKVGGNVINIGKKHK